MTSSLTLTRVETGDIPSMYRISRRAHLSGYDGLIAPSRIADFTARYSSDAASEKRYVARMERRLGNPSRWLAVAAHRDGHVVGYTLVLRGRERDDLKNVFVDPDYQGIGIGRALVSHTLSELGDDRVVSLSVISGNRPARSLYGSFGFITEALGHMYFGADQVVMVRRPHIGTTGSLRMIGMNR